MAPSTKKDTTDGAQQEPQIPDNSYPFSQKFRPEPQADADLTGKSDSPLLSAEMTSPADTESNSSIGGSDFSARESSTEVSFTPSSTPAPSQEEPGSSAHAPASTQPQASSLSPNSLPPRATLPPVAPQSAAPTEKQVPQNTNASANNAEAQPTRPAPDTAIAMPAAPFSGEDSPDGSQASEPFAQNDETKFDKDAFDESTVAQKADPVTAPPLQEDGQSLKQEASGQALTLRTNQEQSPKTQSDAQSEIQPNTQPDAEPETQPETQADKLAKKLADKLAGPQPEKQESTAHQTTTGEQDGPEKQTDDAPKKSRLSRKDKKATKDSSAKKSSPNHPSKQQEASLAFATSHPILPVPPSMPGGLSNALFNSCGYAPWLFLTLLFVLQTLFTLDVRALWYSDEVRHAAVFTSMLHEGNIFKLELNGQLYPDKPSLYFWFLRGLYEIFQEEGPRLYFGAAAISGLLFLWSSLLLGRLVGRFDGRSLFAGGILLICGSYFMGVIHYARMDLLFSTFIIGSYTAFFLAFTKHRAPLLMSLAFILGALACLTKGPLGLALPLSTLVLFALWRGNVTRFFSLDFLIGFVIAALIIGGWLAGLAHETSLSYIQDQVLGKQVLERAVDAFHHKAKWSYYLERLPILLMPWIALILCLPFHKLFTKKFFSTIMESRTPEREGQAFLWCIVLSALLLLSAISTKIIIYLLPALPAICLIAGRAALQLSGKRATAFKLLLGLTLLLGGAALFIATLKVFGSVPLPDFIDNHIPAWEIPTSPGFFISTGILCATALFLILCLPSSRPEGVLLTLALMSTALAYPLFGMAAPSLDTILSPKAQGQIFKQYIGEGYHPLTYDMYDGIYTYYAESTIDEIYSLEEITDALEKHPRVIMAIQQRALNKLADMPECLVPIHKQMIEQHEYVLLACPPLPDPETVGTTDGTGEIGITDGSDVDKNTEGTAPAVSPEEISVTTPEVSSDSSLATEPDAPTTDTPLNSAPVVTPESTPDSSTTTSTDAHSQAKSEEAAGNTSGYSSGYSSGSIPETTSETPSAVPQAVSSDNQPDSSNATPDTSQDIPATPTAVTPEPEKEQTTSSVEKGVDSHTNKKLISDSAEKTSLLNEGVNDAPDTTVSETGDTTVEAVSGNDSAKPTGNVSDDV